MFVLGALTSGAGCQDVCGPFSLRYVRRRDMGKRRHMAYQVGVRAIVPAMICITPCNVRSWHIASFAAMQSLVGYRTQSGPGRSIGAFYEFTPWPADGRKEPGEDVPCCLRASPSEIPVRDEHDVAMRQMLIPREMNGLDRRRTAHLMA